MVYIHALLKKTLNTSNVQNDTQLEILRKIQFVNQLLRTLSSSSFISKLGIHLTNIKRIESQSLPTALIAKNI